MGNLSEYKVHIIVTIVVIILIGVYNTMLKKRNKVKTAFSSMDVLLKKRYDVMPNLVSMVQKYMAHESELLTKITELRTQAEKTKDINESIELNHQIDDAVKRINVSVEGYPELKANESFLHMQATLNDIEEQISAARRTYNAHVEAYNTFIQMFPLNLLALIFRFKQYNLFEISSSERENKTWM